MDKDLAEQVADIAHRVVASGAISAFPGPGGPVEIPPGLRAAALQRAMVFETRGTVHA